MENYELNQNEALELENEEVVLSIDDILNFEPSIDYKGYSPIEVDKFLDVVMNDYQVFEAKIAELEELLALKEEEIEHLKADAYKEDDTLANNAFADGTQVDMLKRIARLEAAVFGGRNY